jgi:GAF domain-containing protein
MAEISAKITQRVAQRISLDELLNDIVTRICEEFPDIYHAQIFLIDPRGDSARLVASTGPVGKKLIEQQHSLGVGSLSVIGQVTYQGRPIVAQTGSSETVHRRNEFLPDTQSEAAFPLKIGTVLIGALDLQSRRRDAFVGGLVEAFASLADSVALAIDNVRQFERAEARIQENQQLVEQTRTALREVERLNERLTGRAWSEYLRGRRQDLGVEIDFETNAVNPENDWTNTMAEAVQFNHFVQEQQPDRQVIAIPLRVRGQVVGAMEFELDEQQSFTPEDLSLVQEVSDRFGLAAENTRLVEESQRIAQREALVNEISSRLQAANNIEATLTEAARSLRDALKANKVAIRLGSPPASNGNGS